MSSNIKISDLIIDELYKNGIDTIFGVTGGAVVHLFDSASRHPEILPVFFNHEQSAAFAVEAYAKSRNTLGAGIFTTGPGATNALTGLVAAWLDSIPCIYISGQVRANQTIGARKLRQVGTQEVDIVSIVGSVTNYAVTVRDIKEIKYHIQKAIFLSRNERPGPVWLDIPVDIQWSSIDEAELIVFDPEKEFPEYFCKNLNTQKKDINEIAQELLVAKRPLILAGYGVRLSGAEKLLLRFAEKYQIPIITSWNICDMLESNHPLNIGRPGMAGQRGANLAIQNCDFLLSLGSHLNTSITGTLYDAFARDAKIAVIDVDQNELKHISVHVKWRVNADVSDFLVEIEGRLKRKTQSVTSDSQWKQLCSRYKELNNISQDYAGQKEFVNSYYFKDFLSDISKEGDLFVVDGGGTIVYSAFQSCRIKKGQRLILSTALCSMGSGIPESIGVAFGNPDKRIFCFVGDGSFPFNMQELQLIKDRNLKIKIFIFNNGGYVSIRSTQSDFLNGNFAGSDVASGLSLPNIKNVARAFGLGYYVLQRHSEVREQLSSIIENQEPLICEVMVSPTQEIVPRQGFVKKDDGSFTPRPLEDMYPFLNRETYKTLMVVEEWNEDNNGVIGQEINLLKSYPESSRPIEDRGTRKLSGDGYMRLGNVEKINEEIVFEQFLLKKAREFGEVYFDDDRLFGYGGYSYDKKYWYQVAKDIIEFYNLKAGDKVLDVGCAKGFLLNDLKDILPGLEVNGIDISAYAIGKAMSTVKDRVQVGDARMLPFSDNEFDLVLSINTLSELDDAGCRQGLREIERVSRGKSFVTVNSWKNEIEKQRLLKWNLTAQSNHSREVWKEIFEQESYFGDYYWFILS